MNAQARRRVGDDDLSEEACRALFTQIVDMTTCGGTTRVHLRRRLIGAAEWSRNRMRVVSDIHDDYLTIAREVQGIFVQTATSRSDADSLRQSVRTVEEMLLLHQAGPPTSPEPPYVEKPMLHPVLWSAATAALGASGCTEMAQPMMAAAEAAGMVTAGAMRVVGQADALMDTRGLRRFYRSTEAQCSLTVRDIDGSASGWAGVSHYDLQQIDSTALAARAVRKARESRHPVAIEPGHYTAILEPQATADLLSLLGAAGVDRDAAERRAPPRPFSGPVVDTNRISEHVLDGRLILRADPMDPDGGFVPFDDFYGDPYQPVNWIERGVLRQLGYHRHYAVNKLGYDQVLPATGNFRLMAAPDVPTLTVDEMIAKTERGVLVTRFSGVRLMNTQSLLCEGYTRDGLWLVENGKVTKPIKNFRFVDSALFVLNNLEDVGVPVRVFAPGASYIAPPVRVRDFSFVSLADAI